MASRRCILMVDAYCSGYRRMQKEASADTRAFYSYWPTPEVLAEYLRRAGYLVTVTETAMLISDYYARGTLLV
jgi:hypothetical protein